MQVSRVHAESADLLIPFTQSTWHRELREFMRPYKKGEKKGWKRALWPHKFLWKPKSKTEFQKMRPVIGIDTETYANSGNILCLNTSVARNDYLIGTPYQRLSIDRIFDFLARYPEEPLFVAWNLKFDATAILKGLATHEDLVEFKINHTTDAVTGEIDEEYYVKTKSLEVKYIPKKMLALTHLETDKKVEIFDAMQFYMGSLDSNAKKYKKELEAKGVSFGKEYNGKYKNKRFPDNVVIDEPEETKEILEYCYKDCVICAKLLEIWMEGYYTNFGFYPPKLYSTGYITMLYVQTQLESMFTFTGAPYEVQDMAYRAYYGGRFENLCRGLMYLIYHYDINSAYPYAMVEAPDFVNARWIHITKLNDFIKNKNKVGFYKIKVTVNEDNVCPFLFRERTGAIVCPSGTFTTSCTADELRVALEHYKVTIHKINGYYCIPRRNDKNAFSHLVEKMYEARLKQTDEVQKFVYKVLINSLYGKFAQHKPEPKNLFNPVMCSYITGKCRAMLLEAAAANKDKVVAFATDAIFSKVPIEMCMKKTGKKVLGEWDDEVHAHAFMLMPGIYQYAQKGKDDYTKTRGFGTRVFKEKDQDSQEKFTIQDWEISEDGEDLVQKFELMRPVSISEAVIQKKYSIDDLCKMEFHEKRININGDNKRFWFDGLDNVFDYNDSMPLNMQGEYEWKD